MKGRPGRWRRRARRHAGLAVAVLLAAPSAAAHAEFSVAVDPPRPAATVDTDGSSHDAAQDSAAADSARVLVASFRLDDLFEDRDERLGEGLAATLTVTVDLWRVREGWWDALTASQTLTYRFRREPGRDAYVVRNPDRTTGDFPDRAALSAHLERVHELGLGPPERFPKGTRFYVIVRAALKPLTLDDLEELDAWLSGDVAEGRGGGLLGVPRALAGLVVDLSGMGDRSAAGRSAEFVPNP